MLPPDRRLEELQDRFIRATIDMMTDHDKHTMLTSDTSTIDDRRERAGTELIKERLLLDMKRTAAAT